MSSTRASFPDVPVAINAVPLLTPLTGIGQYTFHLANAMGELLPGAPFLFYGSGWSREVRAPPAPASDSVAGKMKRAVPMGYRIARWMQQSHFSRGARRHRIGLYHEPNYLAFEFEGPTVVTIHDLSWVRYPETHPAERVASMNETMPRVVREAAQIIADSDFTRREILEHYGASPEKVTTVPLGVLPQFAPRTAADCAPALGSNQLRFGRYVLAVGTLEPRKNLATAAAAFALLPAALRREFPLAIAGGTGWGAEAIPLVLRDLVASGEARVLGYVSPAELPFLYAGARMLVYPSLYEGFGLPPLESMASSVPVIVSDRGSLPEVVGEAGMLVEATDALALSHAMRRLLEEDDLHARLSAAGVVQAAQFSWERCALATLHVYRRALERGG